MNAINDWNTATDGSGNRSPYYFVLDQQAANITVRPNASGDNFYMSSNADANPSSPNRTNMIWIHPIYNSLSGQPFGQDDIDGAIKHEMAHLIGIGNAINQPCVTIMRGLAPNAMGLYDGNVTTTTVQQRDVAQVRQNNTNPGTLCGLATQNDTGGLPEEPVPTPTPTSTPTPPECAQPGQPCSSAGCCNPNENWCNGNTGVCTDCPGQLVDGFCTETPIVIDVLGNGFNLTNLAGGVSFDLDADGTAEHLSWTSAGSDDAWLALDRNDNGTIDTGVELFGEFTPQPEPPVGGRKNGFIALAELDKSANGGNGDGNITAADAAYANLRVWRDDNHNGVSEPGELVGLEAVALAVIDLDYKESKVTDQHGNRFRFRTKVKNAAGQQLGRWIYDVFLLRAN